MATSFACQRFVTQSEFVARAECECEFNLADPNDVELIGDALDNASDILSLATDGRISGICELTVRPIGQGYCDGPVGHFGRLYAGADSFNLYSGMIPLPGPNTMVERVVVDGVVLSAVDYELVNGRWLHRVDGSWPSGSLTPDDFEIVVRFGRAPDLLTRNATIELACELAAFARTGRSRLPAGVVSANIQGASVNLRDEEEEIRQYLPRVGAFLAVYAPRKDVNSGGVWSPELSNGWELVTVTGPSQS